MKSRHTKRAWWHDYYSRSIYLITLNKRDGVPDFGRVAGDCNAPKGSKEFPFVAKSEIGTQINRMIYELKYIVPHLRVLQHVVMPDHIHILIFIQKRTPLHLGKYISKFRYLLRKKTGMELFEPGFNDKILTPDRSLDAIIQYIKENPYRLLLRRLNRSFFERNEGIRLNGKRYMAYGNLQLLKNPFMEAIIIHRRYTDEERRELRERWLHLCSSGGVAVSPFISPKEKEIRKEIEALGGAVVLIVEKPFPESPWKPAKHDFDQCGKGELVILAPLDEDWSEGQEPIPRSCCLKMNALAEYLAGRQ